MPEGQIIIFHILGIKAKLKVFNKQTHFTVLIILLFSILFKKKMQETMSETDFFSGIPRLWFHNPPYS